MGFATFVEYAERVVGLRPRQTEERLRVAHALEKLPELSTALAEGRRHFSAVRELSRVASPETEHEWLDVTEGMAVGEIEKMVAGRRPGDRPDDPPSDEARRHTVILELPAETYALYREAQAKIRRDTDERLTEEEGLLLMARTVLGGPDDAGRSSYQVRVTQCESCGRATVEGRGQAVTVEPAIAELTACDAQRIEDNGKATQDIPPMTRRLVVRRHNGRCAVPGCRNAQFVDVHHVQLRSEGGRHDADNLTVLCGSHHAAVHRGALLVEGSWSAGLIFRHADGSRYGGPADPRAAAILSDVHQALTGMGFKEGQARAIVTTVRPHVGASTTVTDVLRHALRIVREGAPCRSSS